MKAFIVLCLIAFSFLGADAFRAGVVDISQDDVTTVLHLIQEAGQKDVDILLVPSDIQKDSYHSAVKALSKAAKQAGLYLVAHVNEPIDCQKSRGSLRSNLVFDRHGTIIAVYRKPSTTTGHCTAATVSSIFNTDFGVSFNLMMEEDLVLKSPELNRNYIVAGAWASEIPFLNASQFASSWSYTANANVVSEVGIFAGRAGFKPAAGSLVTADLKINPGQESVSIPPMVNPETKNFPGEDLSQYIFRPLDVEASSRGLSETLCHNAFCCQFYVKTHHKGGKQEANYGLAVFDGIRHYGADQYIGTQNCAVFACAGINKNSCRIGSVSNNTNIVFEKLIVTANFTNENSVQYPVILSNEVLPADKFNFHTESDENTKKVTIELRDGNNLYTFGIFGRDFENDYRGSVENQDDSYGIYDYIFNEDLQEIFDYLWIRLRILLFIVSIYVLEMM